ncbi:hypothetical protein ACJX0J_007449, partial [Zea mays]
FVNFLIEIIEGPTEGIIGQRLRYFPKLYLVIASENCANKTQGAQGTSYRKMGYQWTQVIKEQPALSTWKRSKNKECIVAMNQSDFPTTTATKEFYGNDLIAEAEEKKSYANQRRRPHTFQVGDFGMQIFGVKNKLAPRYDMSTIFPISHIGSDLVEQWKIQSSSFGTRKLFKFKYENQVSLSGYVLLIDFFRKPWEKIYKENVCYRKNKIAFYNISCYFR